MSSTRALLCTEDNELYWQVEQVLNRVGAILLGTARATDTAAMAANLKPDVVLIDDGAADLELVADLRNLLPSAHLVVLTRQADFGSVRRAMRSGAHDVLAYPSEIQSLPQYLLRNMAPSSQARVYRGDESVSIAVYSGTGGAGKSFLTANLGVMLQKHMPTMVVDLSLYHGTLDLLLGIKPHQTMADLIKVMDELSHEHLAAAVIEHPSGLHLLCAPPDPTTAFSITSQHVQHLVNVCRTRYGCVLMDLPSDLSAPTRAAISKANLLLYVINPNIAAVTVAQRTLRTLEENGFKHRSEVVVVLNKAGARHEVSLADIKAKLGMDVLEVNEEMEFVETSVNEGRPVAPWGKEKPARRARRLVRSIQSVTNRLLQTV